MIRIAIVSAALALIPLSLLSTALTLFPEEMATFADEIRGPVLTIYKIEPLGVDLAYGDLAVQITFVKHQASCGSVKVQWYDKHGNLLPQPYWPDIARPGQVEPRDSVQDRVPGSHTVVLYVPGIEQLEGRGFFSHICSPGTRWQRVRITPIEVTKGYRAAAVKP